MPKSPHATKRHTALAAALQPEGPLHYVLKLPLRFTHYSAPMPGVLLGYFKAP